MPNCCNYGNTTGATSGAWTTDPSATPEFISGDKQHNGQKKDKQHNGQEKDKQRNGQKKKDNRTNKQCYTKPHTEN
jgi:hypothetical protein